MISASIYPLIETEHKELRVITPAEQASITLEAGKKMRVFVFEHPRL